MIWDEPPTKRPTAADFARFFQKIEDDIERVGWSAVGVMDNPPFTYTVGLTESYDHPELIIYGIGAETAHGILSVAVHHIEKEYEGGVGKTYEAGQRYDEILDGYEVLFVDHPADFPLTAAASYYKAMGKEWEALQLVWPDVEGKFPGEESMDPDYEKAQEQKVEDDET